MIMVLLIAGAALAFAVLACVAIDSPASVGEAAAALAGAPFPTVSPSLPPADMFPRRATS